MSQSKKLRLGYIRVSTNKGEQLAALENQRSRVEAAGVDEVIQDIQSGRDSDRAGLLELLERISRGLVSELVITRVDRLGRDAADTDALIAFAAKKSVAITALDGGSIESESPSGFVLSRMLTTLAEMESRMLSRRIKDGFKERRRKSYPCRGRVPWGYRNNSDRTALEPDPEQWPRAQDFLALLALCKWRMNTALTEWERQCRGYIPLHSCRAVKSWLLNPALRGGLGYIQKANHRFANIVWDTHPSLITHEEFAAIERQLEVNRRMWGRHNQRKQRLLTSLCRCGSCSKAMSYAGSRTIPAVVCRTRGCPQQYKSTHESLIAGAITHTLAAHADDLIRTAPKTDSPEILALQASITSLESLNDPDCDEILELKRKRLVSLRQQPKVEAEVLAALRDPGLYEHATYEELTVLFHRFVAQVVVTNQAVERVVLRF